MDTAQDKSVKDQSQESACQPPPFPELTQLVMPGFEHLSRPYTLRKAPRQAKARKQRRSRKVSDAPYPGQLSLPLNITVALTFGSIGP